MRGARLRALVQRALLAAWILLLVSAAAVAGVTPPGSPQPGPPYPPPVIDVVVYDYADLFTDETEASATATIVAIENRVKAEIVVYTQLKPGSDEGSTESDARRLINQYGVGRQGFDDGVAILFNMNRRVCQPGVSGNGQVQLFAGPGYAATFLSDSERQAVFENDMLPRLRECDMDGALLVALEKIDANATAEHAQALNLARQANAAVGLVGAPVMFLVLVGVAARSWLRYGRDPVYLDSPSILMPAPPPDLTAASGALVWEGKTTRRALTTALLDLASRGELNFRTEQKLIGRDKAGIQLLDEPPTDPYAIRNRRRPLSAAEGYALTKLRILPGKGDDGYLSPTDIEGFATSVAGFTERLEKHVARKGWFREPPAKAVSRWTGRGGILFVLGIVAFAGATSLPSDGLTLLAVAVIAAGVVITGIARVMPARTMAGAMIYAMLAAYRRTLQKTMAQARSMQEVVAEAQLEWLETPDQAVVWGVALGLHREVEDVLARSVEDAEAGITEHSPWVPAWYGSQSSLGSSGAGGSRGLAPGLFSSSAVPNFGGMMAALGSIGSAASSSGGSGGFSGGSSGGGGGGGAGGGF
jgi:uncharacterized membrane protein YgcG